MRRAEAGSALVELVFVVTLLFSFLFGIIDFALIEASDNAGSNAAREGARAATLNVNCADLHAGCTNPNPALQAITAKVQSRLGGLVAGAPTVAVVCWDGTSTGTVKSCDPSTIVPGVDLVEVDVTWTRLATSPYGTATTHTDKAKMTIDGSGQGTHSSACQVISSTVTPTPDPPAQAQIASGTSGQLTGPVTVTAQTNGLCQPLYISFSTGSTPDQSTPVLMSSSGTDTFSYTIGAGQYNWVPGSYNINLSESGMYPVDPAPAPMLTVVGNSCMITAASVSPSAVVLSGSTSPGTLASDVTLGVTSTSQCTSINAVFNPDGNGPITVALTGSAPNWSLPIAAGKYNWTTGSKQFAFTNPATSPTTALQTPSSVLLQVALRCAVSVTLSPPSMSKKSVTPVVITATATAGADCTGLAATYVFGSGPNKSAPAPQTTSGPSSYSYTIPSSTQWESGSWPITFSASNTAVVSTSPSPTDMVVTNS